MNTASLLDYQKLDRELQYLMDDGVSQTVASMRIARDPRFSGLRWSQRKLEGYVYAEYAPADAENGPSEDDPYYGEQATRWLLCLRPVITTIAAVQRWSS